MALDPVPDRKMSRPAAPKPTVPRLPGPRQAVGEGVRPPGPVRVQPNLGDYKRVRRDFSWDAARTWLTGLPGGRGLNIAYEAVDRHAEGSRVDQVAVRCRDRNGRFTELTYGELRSATNRFANVLRTLGVQPGDRVLSLLGRVPAFYVTALGTLKNLCVHAPLADLAPDAIRQQLAVAQARVLVTTPELYKRKIAPIRDGLSELRHVLVVGDGFAGEDAIDLHAALADADDTFDIPPTDPQTTAFLHFTRGTTGTPKVTIHPHEAVIAQHATGAYALDLHAGDVFWYTADPSGVAGTAYGLVAPLTHGATLVADDAGFDVRGWYELLQDQRVTVWYTAPGPLRTLMRHGVDLSRMYDFSALRFVASVGEPLDPPLVVWGQDAFGRAVHDTWWQAESGAILLSNFASMDIRPGSMGKSMPGVKAALLARGPDGRAEVVDGEVHEINDPDEIGEIAIRPGWPSMFTGYMGEHSDYDTRFVAGWYLTGDLARRDHDGYFWFAGRVDDVIRAGERPVGAYEIERVLTEHPAVAEAAAIGKPDDGAGESVKAFLTLHPGWQPNDELRVELLAFAQRSLGCAAPAELSFEQELPRTRGGTLLRRLLRARELGLPEGDLSTAG